MQILYADLIRIAIAPPSLDPYFLAFTVTSIVIFTLEIVLSSLCRQGYVFRCVYCLFISHTKGQTCIFLLTRLWHICTVQVLFLDGFGRLIFFAL